MAKLPVLMYHNVCHDDVTSLGLTISAFKLEQQFKYLKDRGYSSFFLSELMSMKVLPRKSICITFDDVTLNQLTYAYPLLKLYNLKATFFIPFKYVGKHDLWNEGIEPIMTTQQLIDLDSNYVELGHHSYSHPNFSKIDLKAIESELKASQSFIKSNRLNVIDAIAYPYGKYPKHGKSNQEFKSLLKQYGMKYGLRIGNRVNTFPFKDSFEIQRIDIKGEDSLSKFKFKLKFGKIKLF